MNFLRVETTYETLFETNSQLSVSYTFDTKTRVFGICDNCEKFRKCVITFFRKETKVEHENTVQKL